MTKPTGCSAIKNAFNRTISRSDFSSKPRLCIVDKCNIVALLAQNKDLLFVYLLCFMPYSVAGVISDNIRKQNAKGLLLNRPSEFSFRWITAIRIVNEGMKEGDLSVMP